MRVTSDTFEYREWPSRKPSKKRLAREAFKADPIGTTGSIAQIAGKRAIERAGEQSATRVLRSARGAAVAPVLAGARVILPSLAILAAGYVVTDAIAKNQRLKLGDRVNAISRKFVELQQQVMRELRVGHWQDVPQEVRNKAVADYKRALATATAQAQGSAFVGARESYK